jgi:hypothetical protein
MFMGGKADRPIPVGKMKKGRGPKLREGNKPAAYHKKIAVGHSKNVPPPQCGSGRTDVLTTGHVLINDL